jgi:3-hydroxyisobutyrate dehydrogenase-like beta-hydroxyacid dehydrogenase
VSTVGIVSPGAMGSAVGAVLARGDARVVVSLAGRSARTRRLAEAAGLTELPSLQDVVGEADVVLSIAPPEAALEIGTHIGYAARAAGAQPLVADLNAVAPETARALAIELARAGLDLVDGSISGPPPWKPGTRVYLSGERAHEIAKLPLDSVERIVVGAEIGTASAVKMSTASVYKGTSALLAQALLAAQENGVLEHVLADLRAGSPALVANVERRLTSAASKSARYVGEMREIAAAQGAAGLTPALFEAMAEVFSDLSKTALAQAAPEDVGTRTGLAEVLAQMRNERRTNDVT